MDPSFDTNPQNAINRRALAVLARTCKLFLDPALDVLWSSRCPLAYLLSVLPQTKIANVRGIPVRVDIIYHTRRF